MHALPFFVFLVFLLFAGGPGAQAQVYRCGNAYSGVPCTGGRLVDVSPQVSDPDGPRTTLIHLCRQPGNRLAWHAAPCSASGLVLERSERVPVQLDWQEQVAAASQLYAQARAWSQGAAPAAPGFSGPQGASRALNRQAQCQSLEEHVRQLDSMGRAGSRHHDLERLRRERKEARDAQFRLQCR